MARTEPQVTCHVLGVSGRVDDDVEIADRRVGSSEE
jgi:hypothetical protein